MAHMMNPQIILLKEGTDTSQGKPQLISNINACIAVVDTIRTTLGPRGMDKLVYNENGRTTISNDGATIMKLLDIVHPAAKTLVDIAMSQDAEVGDGTTSVVLLAGAFLKEAKNFIEDGVHPQIIIRAFRLACELAKAKINEVAISVDRKDAKEHRELLERCAATSLNSKLIGTKGDFFAPMVVDAVLHLDDDLDLAMIGVKKEKGGALEESVLVEGVAFKKCFSYAGFECQPKSFDNPKIILLNLELELKREKENAEVRIESVADYQSIVDAEWRIIYEKLEKIVESGAQVVLSRLAIGDLATQYFADRNIFCAGRVPDDDLKRMSQGTGAVVQTTVNDVPASALGECGRFDEKQVGGERYNLFSGCPKAKTVTIILRGGGEQFTDEAERSLHDAIMIVRRAMKSSQVVGGGGAIEIKLSTALKEHSRTIAGKQQLIVNAFAKALETIPRQIAENAGFDSIDILNKLRQKHAQTKEGSWYGVDIKTGGICDTVEAFVWEPAVVKLNSITAATDACNLILSVDETVRNPKAQDPNQGQGGAPQRPY
eukprot:TRINITY_DN7191_c0_g1_i1.p1 TRINITY_DN7191_c0_g1~~TRINITY_DN7191_c0_g1_i1.p1  ORF type:complete len:546 (-),score=211.03 TRINITY_DN7191_c0_g1_i1:192-1829(-)